MASSFILFQPFLANLFNGQCVPGTNQLKLALTNVLPQVTFANFSQITEIAPGGGYVAGGVPLVVVSSSQSAGIYTLILQNFTLLATGAAISNWEWAVIYDSVKGTLIGFADFGSVVLQDISELVNFTFDPINGLLQAVPSG